MSGAEKLKHLTEQEHVEAARLLREVQSNLQALTGIVLRAPFTDRVMRIQKSVQERLIDPLSEARGHPERYDEPALYPAVGYIIGPVR